MHTILEALRMGLNTSMTNRQIGRALGIAPNTVGRYRKIVAEKRLFWPDLELMDYTEVEGLVRSSQRRFESKRPPDWTYIHREMQKRDVKLILLWEEYRLANPGNAYAYSQFTHLYREYVGKLDLTMRQTHRAGECVFVDFAGRNIPWTDRDTGEVHKAQIFISALGGSSYIFILAVKSQSLADWIEAHIQMLKFYDGSPEIVVPDNLKSAVTKASREPIINRLYLELGRHYGFVIVPTRVRRPKDKAKAEVSVQIAERWVIARLRNRQFFSLAEINAAIADLLAHLNNRPFKKLPGCRRSRFEELDKPALKQLPAEHFEYAEWVGPQKVGPDYHVFVKGHYYSVPYPLVQSPVEARMTATIVEIFHRGKRVAVHARSNDFGGHTTTPDHQPQTHRHYAEQSEEKYMAWAETVGVAAHAVVRSQFLSRPHELLAVRACASLQRLAKDYGPDRFEAACRRAQAINSLSVKSVRSILSHGLSKDDHSVPVQTVLPLHENVRGATYFKS